jgi:hypothetical protein
MRDTEEDYEENEDVPRENDYENPEHLDENFLDVADLPPIEGAEYIAKIEDPEVREREVEAAGRIYKKRQDLERKLDSGEISQGAYEHERHLHGIKTNRAITRWELAAQGVTYDKIGDTMEDWNHIPDENLDLGKYRSRIKETAEEIGPESAQEVAERRRRAGKLSKDGYDIIMRQVDQVRRRRK